MNSARFSPWLRASVLAPSFLLLSLTTPTLAQTPTPTPAMSHVDTRDARDNTMATPTSQTQAFASSTIVAISSPNGLIASTGNLYWTSKIQDEFGPDISTVWRAGKNNVPGNETVLYREYGDDRFFGDIVYANPGTFYGYFVTNYQVGGSVSSQIKRVPLTGGPAIVIANSPAAVGSRDLVTDGTTLFWVDAGGIRSVPLGGGPVTTLRSSDFVTRLRIDSSYIYYGEEFLIFRMPKSGGSERVVVSTSGKVTALHVDASIGWLIWGEQGGGGAGDADRTRWPKGDLPGAFRRQRRHLRWMGRLTSALVGLPATREHQLHDQKA